MTEVKLPSSAHIAEAVRRALAEDIGDGDITAQLLKPEAQGTAELISREPGTLCGVAWATEALAQIDPSAQIKWRHHDGDDLDADQVVAHWQGRARSLVTAERVAINFLQTMSGTATATAQYASKIAHTKARLLDTRKTIPLLRLEQKYAVAVGGGRNHRIGLYDAYLIKENHIATAGSVAAVTRQARALEPDKLLEIEVETLDQLRQAVDAGVDRVLLDNFTLDQLREAVALVGGTMSLEASGSVDLKRIVDIAETGVDFISVGGITKHLRAHDFSLRFD